MSTTGHCFVWGRNIGPARRGGVWFEEEEEEKNKTTRRMKCNKTMTMLQWATGMKRELERRKVEIQQSGPEQWMELRWIEHGNAEIAAIFQKYFD